VQSFESPHDEPVINAVQQVADARRVPMAQIALAWVLRNPLRNPLVDAPLVGATQPHHLQQAAEALDLQLTDEEAASLEKPNTNAGPSRF